MAGIGFGKKLYISSISIILLTIFIIAGVNFVQTKKSFLTKGKAGIQSVSDVLLSTVEVQYGLQRSKLDSDLGMLKTETSSGGKITTVQSRTVQIPSTDLVTGQSGGELTLPKMVIGFKFITADYEIVDRVGKFSDSEIMFFQLAGDKLVKVSTSQKGEGDNRSIGGFYPKDSPACKAVTQEKSHLFLSGTGRDKTIHLLSPFRDELEDVLAGAFGISRKILTPELVDLVKKITVNGRGYAFISDAKGDLLVHPDKAYAGLNLSAFKGGDGILKTQKGFVTFEHGDDLFYAYVTYFKPWDLYFTVAVSQSELMEGVNGQILKSALFSGAIALVLGFVIIWIINRQLMSSMTGMADLAKAAAKGDFKHSFTYKARDAIHDTVDAMNEMVSELAGMIRELNTGVGTLSSASQELDTIADRMSQGAQASLDTVNKVSSAAGEMSTNMDSVAAAMEEASTNVETVSQGTGQMRSSIETVARNSAQTREITGKAVEKAKQTSERVLVLGRAAEKINKVTETITTISSQTNLLALNATIEAARAGEAGKGFAVVANEIKELAGQTAAATDDIGRNIKEIQEQIQGAVEEIKGISTIVHDIDGFVNEAAQAIEIQSETTGEIAENISQVSLGIQEVNTNISQSSEASSQVARDISGVLDATRRISEFSEQVKDKAGTLKGVMDQLASMTQKFKI